MGFSGNCCCYIPADHSRDKKDNFPFFVSHKGKQYGLACQDVGRTVTLHFPQDEVGNALYISMPKSRGNCLFHSGCSNEPHFKDTPTTPTSPLSHCSSLFCITAQRVGQALFNLLILL